MDLVVNKIVERLILEAKIERAGNCIESDFGQTFNEVFEDGPLDRRLVLSQLVHLRHPGIQQRHLSVVLVHAVVLHALHQPLHVGDVFLHIVEEFRLSNFACLLSHLQLAHFLTAPLQLRHKSHPRLLFFVNSAFELLNAFVDLREDQQLFGVDVLHLDPV